MCNRVDNEINWQLLINRVSNETFLAFWNWYLSTLTFQSISLTLDNTEKVSGTAVFSIGIAIQRFQFNFIRRQQFIDAKTLVALRAKSVEVDKGMIFTTGNFTREAKKEARKKGVFPIDLINISDLSKRLTLTKIMKELDEKDKITAQIAQIESFLKEFRLYL